MPVGDMPILEVMLRQLAAQGFRRFTLSVNDLAPGVFAVQIRAPVTRGERPVGVGNLETGRDFIDERDAVRAMSCLCRRTAPGEIFNLYSGVATPMRAPLDAMLRTAGGEWRVEVDAAKFRDAWDIGTSCGPPGKIRAHCGWRPTVLFTRSVAALLSAPANDRRYAGAMVSQREFPRIAMRDGRRNRRRRVASAAPD